MPLKDIVSDLQPRQAFNASITSSTTTVGATIDTTDFDLGLMFDFQAVTYTDGTYTVVLYHGDASNMSDEAVITSDNLIGSLPVISALTAAGAILNKVGVFGTKRYVRAKIVSTSVTTGARIVGNVTQKGEVLPAATS